MDSGLETAVTVLLVGRSANSTFVLRNHLQKLGCSVSTLHSCGAALKSIRQAHFDFVLSEFLLPGETAYQFLGNLRGTHCSLFFYIPVEDDSWWIPALCDGRECLGAPAVRSAQFAKALQEMVEQRNTGSGSREEDGLSEASGRRLRNEFPKSD